MTELQEHIKLVKSSIAEAKESRGADVLAEEMLNRFFTSYPETKEIFAPFNKKEVDMTKFSMVAAALIAVLEGCDLNLMCT